MAIQIGDNGDIAAVFPIIELHNFVFRASRKTLVELVANNGLNAGIVISASDLEMPAAFAAEAKLGVRINGRMVDEAGLWPLPGGAEASLDWLQRDLVRDGLSLKPGQIVIAGTPLGLYPVHRGYDRDLHGRRAARLVFRGRAYRPQHEVGSPSIGRPGRVALSMMSSQLFPRALKSSIPGPSGSP